MRLTKPQEALLREIATSAHLMYVAPHYKPIAALEAHNLVSLRGPRRYALSDTGREWLAAHPVKEMT